MLVEKFGEGTDWLKNMKFSTNENNCLHMAVSRLYNWSVAKLVTYLVDTCKIDVNAPNLLGEIPIQLLPKMFGSSQVQNLLLQLTKYNSDIHHRDKLGNSYFNDILKYDIQTAEKIINETGINIKDMKLLDNQNIYHIL